MNTTLLHRKDIENASGGLLPRCTKRGRVPGQILRAVVECRWYVEEGEVGVVVVVLHGEGKRTGGVAGGGGGHRNIGMRNM